MIEKIEFEKDVFIYKTKLDDTISLDVVLDDIYKVFEEESLIEFDAYPYIKQKLIEDYTNLVPVNNSIDVILNSAIRKAIELHKNQLPVFNNLNVDCWINVVRSPIPKQPNLQKTTNDISLHIHSELNKKFHTSYSFVYYVQMPDNLNGNEGSLIVGGETQWYHYLPTVGDLIIMDGTLPHSPNISPNSSKDRIVIAGNIGIENIKKKSTLI